MTDPDHSWDPATRDPHRPTGGRMTITIELSERDAGFAVDHLRRLADIASPNPQQPRAGEIAACCISARFVADEIAKAMA